MTKREWIAIAEVLAGQRAALEAKWSLDCELKDAGALHDRKLIYFATLEAFEKTVLLLTATLDRLCPSFDRNRFLRIANPVVSEPK